MALIQPLPEGALDIVGDIHGEFDALCALLRQLGYDEHGGHPDCRTLVFVGDFCDRGPNSPAVIALVERFVKAGRACAILGNHEINLLRGDAKEGAGWYFDARCDSDQDKYAPFCRPDSATRAAIQRFLESLPIALERVDVRVVHAAWRDEEIAAVRAVPEGELLQRYGAWEHAATAQADGLRASMAAELRAWPYGLENRDVQPPFMQAHADYDAVRQMRNPLKVLTSGVERHSAAPFFASGKWRFAERVQWWNEYEGGTPVIIGHYWRRCHLVDRGDVGKGDPNLFQAIDPCAWHGQDGNVFCVDFSVGGRWIERRAGRAVGANFRLAALRWPERILQFDDGHRFGTQGFLERQLP